MSSDVGIRLVQTYAHGSKENGYISGEATLSFSFSASILNSRGLLLKKKQEFALFFTVIVDPFGKC